MPPNMAIWCCCGDDCPYPELEVTISWTGTPSNVNYQAGPPATIDMFGKTWTSGQMQLLCPDVYEYRGVSTTTGGEVRTKNIWRFNSGGQAVIEFAHQKRVDATYTAYDLNEAFESVRTAGAEGLLFWTATDAAGTFTIAQTTANLTTQSGGYTGVTANDLQQTPVFDQFGGSFTSSNGVTIQWQKSGDFP